MTREQADRLIALMERNGASVNVTDPRVSAVQTWILGLVGVGLIAAGAWVGQSISTLSTTVTGAVTRIDQYGRVLEDHEQRLRNEERRP